MFGDNMTKDFVKGEKICELQLDDRAKLLVYLDKEYDDRYFDSALYFFNGRKMHLLIKDSFAFTIGKNLYSRIYNINAYAGDEFVDELSDSASQEFYDKVGKYFELSECINYDMYLYKQRGKVKFLLNKIKILCSEKEENVKVIHKKIYESEILGIYLSRWIEILEKEFVPRYVYALKRINKDISEEQIKQSLLALKSGTL